MGLHVSAPVLVSGGRIDKACVQVALCVCVLTSFCCSVLLFHSGATESVPLDVACRNLQFSVANFLQRGLGSG